MFCMMIPLEVYMYNIPKVITNLTDKGNDNYHCNIGCNIF